MSTINDFLKSYTQVLSILHKYGFSKATLFKGFSPIEEHNLNLLIEDDFTADNEPSPQTARKLAVKDELTNLLKCKISLSTSNQIDEYYLNKLNSTNSIELTNGSSEKIKALFNQAWSFNPPDKAQFWGNPPSNETKKQIQPPSESLLNQLQEYINNNIEQSNGSIQLEDIFAELKKVISFNPLQTNQTNSFHLVK